MYNRAQGFTPRQGCPNCSNTAGAAYDSSGVAADVDFALDAVAKKVCRENQCCKEVTITIRCDPLWALQSAKENNPLPACGQQKKVKCDTK